MSKDEEKDRKFQVDIELLDKRYSDVKQFWDITYAAVLANLTAFDTIMLGILDLKIVLAPEQKFTYAMIAFLFVYIIVIIRSERLASIRQKIKGLVRSER